MTKKFKNEIKAYIDQDISLFYNGTGNKEAYKNFVKHLSAAPYLKFGFLISKHIHPTDSIFLVDFENETIKETSEKIKLIPLTNL